MTNKEAFQIFCKKEREIPLFSQPWYLDALCGSSNWDILMVKKGEEIAVTMPILNDRKFVFSLSRMPMLTMYLGPYFPKKFRSEKQKEKLTRALIQELPKFDFFEQKFHHSIINWLPFYWEGFDATIRYTFLIDLTDDLEKIYKNIDSNYRNNKISKAENIIEIVSNRSLEEFYKIQQKTFSRKGLTTPYEFSFLKKYAEELFAQDAGKMFFAIDKKNQIHSAVCLVWDEETAYLAIVGDDPNFRKSGAGIFIVWQSIKYAKEVLGKKRFDFMGSMIEPITQVRKSFGGKQTPYFHINKFESRILEFVYNIK